MTEENKRIEDLESKVVILMNKVNELVACLEENNLSRKVSVDYIYPETMAEEEKKTTEEETPEEAPETPKA